MNPSDSGPLFDRHTEECLGQVEPILRYLMAALRDSRDAEDLAQDVLLQALSKQHQKTGKSTPQWILGIARNRVAMHFRRKAVERRGRTILAKHAPVSFPPSDESTIRRDSSEAVWRSLEGLSEPERTAVILRFSAAYDTTGIAEALDMTPGHLGVVLHRALRKLRDTLIREGCCHEE